MLLGMGRDFTTPEFKKLNTTLVDRNPNPFANNGSAPVVNPFDNTETTTDEVEGFTAMEDDDCPF